jgi:hypothetical protein
MKKDVDYPTADPYLTVTPDMKARARARLCEGVT